MPPMEADEARRWFDSYLADFIALGRGDLDDVRRILDHYGVPMLISTDAGTTVLTDAEQVHAVARQQVDGMRAAGYDRSEELTGETTVLNRTCAVHRARFARLRADGTEISQLEATYVITDGAGGRRVSAIIVHSER
ncbi:hypothetical protein GCM10023320_22420 [Pseudonocardia adelaidensis]|uniref:DUF6841 domain-containing protein n=2 Tax=Pseudonocardia adelaidensis TaxID=648754 RepID=A0ABP9NGI3_9PSEU